MTPAPLPLTACRDCGHSVSPDAVACPECGAPRPALKEWNGEGYEWKSAVTWCGWPLVHVAFGIDRRGKLRTAKGIVAVGQRAVGVVSCGILSAGFVSIGIVSGGVISLGVVSMALALAAGVNAIGPCAIGVTAVGFFTAGVETIGSHALFPELFHFKR